MRPRRNSCTGRSCAALLGVVLGLASTGLDALVHAFQVVHERSVAGFAVASVTGALARVAGDDAVVAEKPHPAPPGHDPARCAACTVLLTPSSARPAPAAAPTPPAVATGPTTAVVSAAAVLAPRWTALAPRAPPRA